MKAFKQILVAIFLLTFITACNKDENDVKDKLEKATISAKWMVSNSSDYYSFEFNESGNYIVVKNTTSKSTTGTILFGTYEIVDDKTITLTDFGTLILSKIDENAISFTIKLTSDPSNEITINASKKEEMESSARTGLLCRTWEMVSLNGEPVVGTELELTVLFSKAGTYFISYANIQGANSEALAQWKWKDESETHFLYAMGENPVWNDDYCVEVAELTSTTLKIIEDEYTYVLQPATSSK